MVLLVRFLHRPGDAFRICYYALSVYFRVGRRLIDVPSCGRRRGGRADAEMAAEAGAWCEPARTAVALAVALTRRGCARRLRPSWPRSSRKWRDGHAAALVSYQGNISLIYQKILDTVLSGSYGLICA